MLLEHINAATKKICPFGKEICFMAQAGACEVVEGWKRAHKCSGMEIELIAMPMLTLDAEKRREASSKGGRSKQANRGFQKLLDAVVEGVDDTA